MKLHISNVIGIRLYISGRIIFPGLDNNCIFQIITKKKKIKRGRNKVRREKGIY